MAYTTIDDPSAYFQTKIYTGNGNDGQAYTFDGNSDMQPDWLWVKNRNNTGPYSGHIFDSSRGANKSFFPDEANAEATNSSYGYLGAFQSDGFTVTSGSSGDERVNNNNDLYVMWGWKANGGTTSSNTSGTITSTVQTNTTAGFSIITYTGNNTAGATFGHGLGAVPAWILVKGRDDDRNWGIYHHKNTSAPETEILNLNNNNATVDNNNRWNDTAPTSTLVTIRLSGEVNVDGEGYVAYCFKEVQGYSKFGTYVGNGNADGPFNYLGFLPKFLIVKRTDSANHWLLMDADRADAAGANPVDQWLRADTNDAESSGLTFDFLSNGFKCRSNDPSLNADGGTYVYMAFAESPFVSSEGVPTTAR
jgi:hypothetical protein